MKLSITDAEKRLLFIVLAMAILAASYFFGFTKLMDQAKAIESSNTQDEATVATLQDMVNRQAETQAETEGFKKSIKEIIAKYPVKIPQEKAIYLIQSMQDQVGIYVSSISFSMSNLVMNFSGEGAPSGRSADLGIAYTCTYPQFKEMLKYVSEFPDRTTMPSVSAAFDQATGLITGNLVYKMYYLTNTEKEYEEFPETGIESGVTSIFYNGDITWEGLEDFFGGTLSEDGVVDDGE
jgi:Tfp pilus assembly protein PilO